MAKDDGAFLTIGELARELGVAQHILRYWETRFPQLRPLQRSGNRRYYRPADVELARRIHRLLNEEGFTVPGAQRALASVRKAASAPSSPEADAAQPAERLVQGPAPSASDGRSSPARTAMDDLFSGTAVDQPVRPRSPASPDISTVIARLRVIRNNLEEALNPG
ncbi:DNA-binding transcriptional MerR regulator [Sphingobium xanthum]|nr:DNA-binding transcriptional MerR regulator [Sphingobium sp. B10D3B]MCW2402135.1 DNA-binding transcriptional MerR regulator [Sphingobium sp. B10D7B]MCW2409114.1 DNA-binding transcriptional MerR regulator [Sphingobium xanthum]